MVKNQIEITNEIMKNLIIIGLSSTAKTIYAFVSKYKLFNVIGFAVNEAYKNIDAFCDKPVYSIESLASVIDKKNDLLFVAIQWNNLNADRKSVYLQLKTEGYKFANLISPNAIINGTIKGENCWIADGAIVDFYTTVGNGVFIKMGAIIGPNCIVDDFCFIGANTTIGGGSIIGEQSFVGLGCVIFDEVKVGEKCIVGAATVLKRNLNDYSLYKTSLDNCFVKEYDENIIETKLQFKKNVR